MAKRKPKRMDPVEITSDGEEFWAVEKIVAHRKVLRGKMEYQVKWLGWPSYENTWEPEENLKALDSLKEYKASRPELLLKIIIPPSTSSRRTVEVARPRSETPSSSSSEETASDDSNDEKKSISETNEEAKESRIPNTLARSRRGKGKNYEPPSDSDQEGLPSPGSPSPPPHVPSSSTVFVPDEIIPEYGSLMFTKNQLERGAVAVRRPDGFNPQRTNPLGTVESRLGVTDPSKPVIHRLPVGQGFKPPVNRVKAKVIDSTENEDNFDENEFTELYQVRNPNAFLSSFPSAANDEDADLIYPTSPPPSSPPSPDHDVVEYTNIGEDVYSTTSLNFADVFQDDTANSSAPFPYPSSSSFPAAAADDEDADLLCPTSLSPSSPPSPDRDVVEYPDIGDEVYSITSLNFADAFQDDDASSSVPSSTPPSDAGLPSVPEYSEVTEIEEEDRMDVDIYASLPSVPEHSEVTETQEEDWMDVDGNGNESIYTSALRSLQVDRKNEVWLNTLLHIILPDKLNESTSMALSDIVFVHITEISALGPCTGPLRAQECKPVFRVYGTDASSKFWKFEEIYPFGGVATFSAEALTN
ncbi:hypothetical protein BT96DRAFT_983465 [Gymnopus androsaceus JB14]|uniref:Chromo domain-containing protein n=1 Tax=Gymnopus androsaceus JB14 TaxID=1447944 RepID=A0A6A4IJH9_9AGAR|nr:hypothetical protein BT96DRAFT_983465 [Gymnopus androsaceus JB14]